WPAVYCNCEYCKKAKALGGKNLRTRSQALVNGDLLLDYPADTYAHALKNGLDLSAAKYCFVTHSHIDHFVPIDLLFRYESYYAHGMTEPRFDIYGNEAVMQRYNYFVREINEEWRDQPIEAHLIKAFEPVTAGDYEVTPLKAYHALGENAFVYVIKQGGKTLLYLHDTGILPEESLKYLCETHVVADLISYDCTYVALPGEGGHMGLDTAQLMRNTLAQAGVSAKHTVSVINHFSHNGKLVHDELAPLAEKLGFITAYDGLALEF
ncbi:MAG: hypothetical protein IK047_05700, partial [Clostridia bacterium]|nr:hypothetical protein [Clostridia bacterium]